MQETKFTIGGGGEKHGKGPKANPVYSDGILYTLGISGVLSAWDAEDGKKRWSKVPGKSLWASTCSLGCQQFTYGFR